MKALVHDGNGHLARGLPRAAAAIAHRRHRSRHALDHLHERPAHHSRRRAARHAEYGARPRVRGCGRAGGEGVRALKPGDRVAVSCETFCGECFYCERGWVNNCVEGGWELGCCEDGCQAELVRVAHADRTRAPIPADVTDEDALFLGDIVATGHWGASIAQIEPGSTGGGDWRRPGRPRHHDVRPPARACHHHRDRHRPRAPRPRP